ncbi:MAG: cytochrome c oxidase accessory protein CcoG [Pseudomonadota bacterium]|nr:cytochrome c oxidase accessory protein CcoG [Pseudomonadota bacterium]
MKPEPDLVPTRTIDDSQELNLYEKREKIYARHVEGLYQKIRLFTGWPLLMAYFITPWISWDGRQAILWDLPARKFYIFDWVFWPQDFMFLAWVLIIAAMGLFMVTNWLGRIWCGYTCPQTVWTAIFMWAEQLTEGSRIQRMKLDAAPWSTDKALRKGTKHVLWIGVAFWTGLTFVGYFTPIRALLLDLLTANAPLIAYAWTLFFTLATYINAGWMREQVCKYMCPYARFQSAMFDQDTLIVSYDPNRGEPRGPRKRSADHRAEGLGDCIDCRVCVQVCPTGIDIRNGLQYECIGCALCIDGCNEIMDKMGYPRGLIRYTTLRALNGGTTKLLRPRPLGYAAVVLGMCAMLAYGLWSRVPLELDIIRDRSRLYETGVDGWIENTYRLEILNMDQQPHRYRVSAEGIDQLQLRGPQEVEVAGGEAASVPVRLAVPPTGVVPGSSKVTFQVETLEDKPQRVSEPSRFIAPLPR